MLERVCIRVTNQFKFTFSKLDSKFLVRSIVTWLHQFNTPYLLADCRLDPWSCGEAPDVTEGDWRHVPVG